MLHNQYSATALDLVSKKLASSGLTLEDMDILQMSPLSPDEVRLLHPSFSKVMCCALKIPYFSPVDGSPHASNPAYPPFYRLRFLRPSGDTKEDIRYSNEPASGCVAYFPRSLPWHDIIKTTSQPLIITEGELKAAKACKEGYPTIGLGGVWNFRSTKDGISFLPELNLINWVRRKVYIAYDSDIMDKKGVRDALNALAEELYKRGASPHLVIVPSHDGKKQGIDDWCVNNPELTIKDLVAKHQPLSQVRKLFNLNKTLTYIKDKSLILNSVTGAKYNVQQFKEAFQNIDFCELSLGKNGLESKPKNIALAWLAWQLREQVDTMTYAPEKPDKFEENGVEYLNLWEGWGCTPHEGDVTPFYDLLNHLFTGATPETLTWFVQWLAYPLQHPATKLYTAAVVYGTKHGTGKSLIGYTMAKIYGSNFEEIGQLNLHNGFNGWAECKQFVMGDDVTGSDRHQDMDTLKKMITQKTLRINAKYMPEYTVPDCVNYFFTSNRIDNLYLESSDRRFFVHEVTVDPLPPENYIAYVKWLENGGAECLFQHLLSLPLDGFNPYAPALKTQARELMIADTRSDLGEWVAQLMQDPDNVLQIAGVKLKGDLYTSAELLKVYDPDGKNLAKANGVTRALRAAGVVQPHKGQYIRTNGGIARYFAVRNGDKWATATPSEIAVHLNQRDSNSGVKF